MIKHYEFTSSLNGPTLRARLTLPDDATLPTPVVVMLTGDGPKGSKSGSWTNIPPKLHGHGIASFLFDFTGLGYSEGNRSQLTMTQGIKDLRAAMELLSNLEEVDRSRYGALGSSFGAAVLLASPQIANRFASIGLKSPAPFLPDAYLCEVGPDLFEKWKAQRHLEENGYSFEVLLDPLKYNVYDLARKITTPCLITHGDSDEIVPVTQSKFLAETLGGPTDLEIFPGTGHGYSEGDAWERMAARFVGWFAEALA